MNPVKFVMEFFLMRMNSVITKEQGILDFFLKTGCGRSFQYRERELLFSYSLPICLMVEPISCTFTYANQHQHYWNLNKNSNYCG